MKIGQPSDNTIPAGAKATSAPAKGGQSAGAATNAAAAKGAPDAGVAVTVSSLARSMGASNRGEAADVDMKKVNAVRTAIAQGTFTVNAEAIADKLLSNAQEMLDRNRS